MADGKDELIVEPIVDPNDIQPGEEISVAQWICNARSGIDHLRRTSQKFPHYVACVPWEKENDAPKITAVLW